MAVRCSTEAPNPNLPPSAMHPNLAFSLATAAARPPRPLAPQLPRPLGAAGSPPRALGGEFPAAASSVRSRISLCRAVPPRQRSRAVTWTSSSAASASSAPVSTRSAASSGPFASSLRASDDGPTPAASARCDCGGGISCCAHPTSGPGRAGASPVPSRHGLPDCGCWRRAFCPTDGTCSTKGARVPLPSRAHSSVSPCARPFFPSPSSPSPATVLPGSSSTPASTSCHIVSAVATPSAAVAVRVVPTVCASYASPVCTAHPSAAPPPSCAGAGATSADVSFCPRRSATSSRSRPSGWRTGASPVVGTRARPGAATPSTVSSASCAALVGAHSCCAVCILRQHLLVPGSRPHAAWFAFVSSPHVVSLPVAACCSPLPITHLLCLALSPSPAILRSLRSRSISRCLDFPADTGVKTRCLGPLPRPGDGAYQSRGTHLAEVGRCVTELSLVLDLLHDALQPREVVA
ncbi:unnamed protein product [Closterium sp. NIES-65]|nr:unnamed protein product [Closterium sp. NIES-65]CAI5943471.1 unnamed protein product [Closterium sp. NIES-65]